MVDYDVIYYFEYYDKGGLLNRVEILLLEYSGTASAIEDASSNPVILQHSGTSVETIDFTVIQGQELQFSFFVPDDDVATFDAIFESDFKDYKIRYYINEQLEFEGYIRPENLSRIHFRNEPFTEFKLSATDGLADLKNITFYDLDEQVVSTRERKIDIIKYALHSLNIDLDFIIQLNTYETTLMASNECTLDVVEVDCRRFLNDDGTPWNCWDVIEAVLKGYNVTLKQYKGLYCITNHHELNSYYYTVDWTTTVFESRTSTNNIVNLTSYAYESSNPTIKKVAPLKRIAGVIHNKDLGADITGVNLADFINVWDAYNYETLNAGTSTLSFFTYADALNYFYIELTDFFGVEKISADDYLRISLDAALYPSAFLLGSNISVRIGFEILHPNGLVWSHTTGDGIGLGWTNIINTLDEATHITVSGNYKVRIIIVILPSAIFADWAWWGTYSTYHTMLPHELFGAYLKNISISRISMSANEAIESTGDVPIVTYDINYKRENPSGIKIVDSEIYFIDSFQLTQMSALSIYTSEFENTSSWNSYNHVDLTNLLSIYTKNILNNRYSYKNSIRATYIDFANTIGFNNIIQIQSKYYQIVTFSKNTKEGKISLELSELLTTQQTLQPVSLTMGDTINGSISSKSVNAITSTVDTTPLNDDYAYLPGKVGGQWLIGGIGVGDQLVFQGTSANGTAATKAIVFKVGNNGSIESISIQNNGIINIPATIGIDYGNGVGFTTSSSAFTMTVASGADTVFSYVYTGTYVTLGIYGYDLFLYGNVITPTIYGGQAVGSSLSLIGTTANGTSSTNAILFKVGNNGATTAGYIKNTGHFYIPILNHENNFYWTSAATENGRLSLIHTDGTIFDYLTSTGITLGMSVGVTGSVTASTYMSIGTYAGSPSFVSGFAGSGWRMALESGNANLSVDNLWVRKAMTVYELIINKIRATNGSLWVTDAVEITGSLPVGGTVYACFIDTDDNNISIPFVVNDVVRCQKWTGRGIKYYSAVVTYLDIYGEYFYVDIIEGVSIPENADVIVRVGNTTDTTRQGSIYLTASDSNAPYLDVMDGVTSVSFSGKTKVRLGKLAGITDAVFGALSGYGLYAENAYLTGGINASTGLIGGFTINATEGLYSGTGTTRVQMKPGSGFWCGSTYVYSAPFRVTQDGALHAELGDIAGFTIDATEGLYAGTAATRVQMKPGAGIWCGATAIGDAPFRTTAAGAVTCTNITATGGTIAGFTIDATEGIYSGTGATRVQMKPGAGFWAGATAQTSSPFYVTQAGKLYCTSLDIKTSSTGQRVELNSTTNILTLYASNGVDYVQIKTMPTDQPVIEIAWYDYLTQLAGGYLRIADDSSLGGSQFRVSARPIYDPLEVAMEGLPTTSEVGGSDWKILYVNSDGRVAKQV